MKKIHFYLPILFIAFLLSSCQEDNFNTDLSFADTETNISTRGPDPCTPCNKVTIYYTNDCGNLNTLELDECWNEALDYAEEFTSIWNQNLPPCYMAYYTLDQVQCCCK